MGDTYLSLVTDFMMETALSGGSPPEDVTAATGDQQKAAYWINQANLQVQREWINWDFLWRFVTVNLTSESNIVPSATETINTVTKDVVNMVKRKSLAIIQSDGSAHFPLWQEWDNSEFKRLYVYEDQDAEDTPSQWSMAPDRVITLSAPILTTGLTAKYEYLRKAKALVNNTDETLIPDDYSRVIIALAKIMYAEHEDAPEVSAGAHEEYDFTLSQLQAAHLPDQGFNRESHSDADLVVSPE